jgi:rhomboid-like protein
LLTKRLGFGNYATKPSPATKPKSEPKDVPGGEEVQNVSELEDWREYDPQYGVPLPGGGLSQSAIERVFGHTMEEEEGNHILCVLQYRRLSGSLAEVGVSFPDLIHPRETYLRGLEYLRETFPVDEEANASSWLEGEVKRLEEEQLLNRAVKLGIYTKENEIKKVEEEQGTEYGRQRYGKSIFEEIRSKNEQKWEMEQKEIKEKEEHTAREQLNASTPKELQPFRDSDTGEKLPTLQGLKKLHELRTEERAIRNKAAEKAASISEDATPDMSASPFKRLWSSTLLTIATLSLCFYFADTYTPPSQSARLFPDTPPAATTCLALFAINLAVFVAWRVPPAWKFLNRTMIVAPAWPRAITLVGSIFSHQTGGHFLANMVFLSVAGPALHELLGRGDFLAIYIGSGVLGAYTSLAFHVLRRNFVAYCQGASGALYGVLAAYCLTTDKQSLNIPFTQYEVPFNYVGLLALCVSIDLLGLITKRTRGIDHVAHLAGFTGGALGAVTSQRKFRNQAQGSPVVSAENTGD